MRKEIFESEEEYRELYNMQRKYCKSNQSLCEYILCVECEIRCAHENGLIKKSELERAREGYYKYWNGLTRFDEKGIKLLVKYKDALEAELEKTKI
jgi:hypothetical protein